MTPNSKNLALAAVCVLFAGGAYQHCGAQGNPLYAHSKVYARQNAQTPEQTKAYVAQTYSQRDKLAPLAPGNVKLTGYFENDIQNSLKHWNKGVLPYAKIADFFRNGRAQFALGEMWGKAVLSGAMLYRYTHDGELKSVLQATVRDILTTIRENGSISCVPVSEQPDGKGGDLWERKYVLLALTAYYTYVEAAPEVLKAMIGEANSLVDQIGDAPKHDILEQGWSWNGIESSSILEPIMRLYEITGDKRYLDFSEYIIRKGGCRNANIFTQALENVPPHEMASGYPKAYEMNSVFNGLVEYYRMTGGEKWKKCFGNYFRNIKKNEITIIGNGGADEPYYPKWAGEAWDNTQKEQANPKIKRMMETCTGVSWMKFCTYILRTTADASAADYIEKYIYNGLIGAMKPGGDGFSYVNLFNGDKVTNHGWGWNFDGLPVTCCNLNGPTGLAYIPYMAVMQSAEGPVVNLYNPLTAKALTAKKKNVELRLNTGFPRSNNAEIELANLKPEKFSVKLRIPSWSKNTKVSVNGKAVPDVTAGQYLAIERKWKKGDKISITLDMQCRVIDAPVGSNPESSNFQAVEYGPIVLARDENIDANYNAPVKFITNTNGTMNITPVKPTLAGTRMEFEVPTTNGKIRMTDYSSVNCWQGKKICTWIPRMK